MEFVGIHNTFDCIQNTLQKKQQQQNHWYKSSLFFFRSFLFWLRIEVCKNTYEEQTYESHITPSARVIHTHVQIYAFVWPDVKKSNVFDLFVCLFILRFFMQRVKQRERERKNRYRDLLPHFMQSSALANFILYIFSIPIQYSQLL